LKDLSLMDEHLPAFPFHQRAKAFAHPPAHVAEDLQAVRAGNEKGYAVVAKDPDSFGKAIKGCKLEAGDIEALELFFRKHSQSAPSADGSGRFGRAVGAETTSCSGLDLRH